MTNFPDRNFDNLAERFEKNVYGGLKGEIRLAVLWKDLQPVLKNLQKIRSTPLRILDVGGGLSQLAIRLAQQGHEVTVNDISPVMLEKAREAARELTLEDKIKWLCGPYQNLANDFQGQTFDLILCHALLEWLQQPELLLPALEPLISKGGYLSLCFYNPAAKIYRNLIRGNFNWVKNEDCYTSDEGSLTPNKACSIDEVRAWLAQANLHIESESGLRVFHDYVVVKRGGNALPDQILEMELEFSDKEPYKWLGRYLHVLARKD
jgi:S-adenosylmethionine-dependent methyltransferase